MQATVAGPDRKAETLSALRARIAGLERRGTESRPPVALGWPGPDAALGGGLAPAALHEVAGPAAAGFAIRLLARLEGPVLWCHGGPGPAVLYGPGLAALDPGLPDRLIVAHAPDRDEGLWAAEESLRAGALAAVVLDRAGRIDLTAGRRLQLAAEAGGTLGLVLNDADRDTAGLSPSAATTRWRVDPAPSPPDEMGETTASRRWRLRLARRRGGGEGAWTVAGEIP